MVDGLIGEQDTGRLQEPPGAQVWLEKALGSWSVGAREECTPGTPGFRLPSARGCPVI